MSLNYNQNNTMKKLGFFFLLWCTVFQLFGQNDNQYKKLINYTFDSTVTYLSGTPGYLLLKNSKGRYIEQAYNYSTGKVYKHTTYKDEALNILHGPMVWLDDNGNLYQKGIYANGMRAGLWRMRSLRGGYSEGPFVNNQMDGPWSVYDTSGIKIREVFYDRDTIKKVLFFNPDGTEKDTTITEEKNLPQVMPSYPCTKAYKNDENCGNLSLQMFLRENIEYPVVARDIGIQGRAYFSFVIDKDGSIVKINTINGICNEIEKEGIRVIKAMPKWKPGTAGGDPVKVMFTLPISFRIY